MLSPVRRGNFRQLRVGGIGTVLLVVLFVLAALGGAGYWYYNRANPVKKAGPLLQHVLKGPYSNVVLEQGEVESGSNVEIRCEVKARNGGGITILSVVPEGSIVKEGDVICKLDSTSLELEKVQQQITVNTAEATVVQARNTFEAAKIAKIEYLEGTFKQEERTILGEVFVAEQNLRSAQLAYESAERLAAKNIITSLQLEGAQFTIDKARNELQAAEGKLEVLRKYTKEKMLKTLDSDIAVAEANLNSVLSSYDLEVTKLNDISTQIEKCTMKAPAAGQVVYVNKFSGRSGSQAEFIVEAGATVREQQPLFRLPDGNNMQVKALVNESRVTLVKVGMPVSIRVDALKDQTMQGEVVKVNQYAEPGGWTSGTIKKYATIIRIIDPPPQLRVNMNAEVRIFVERRPEALQVPVQALAEYKGHYFALVKDGESYDTRELTVGSTNDQTAVIENGLTENDEVVLNPRSHLGMLNLPEIADVTPVPGSSEASAGNGIQQTALNKEGGEPRRSPGSGGPDGGPNGGQFNGNGPPSGGQFGGGGPPGGARPGGGFGPPNPSRILERLDTDHDGKLSMAELNAADRGNFASGDTNNDGFVDMSELTAVMAQFMNRPREGGPPANGGVGGGAR